MKKPVLISGLFFSLFILGFGTNAFAQVTTPQAKECKGRPVSLTPAQAAKAAEGGSPAGLSVSGGNGSSNPAGGAARNTAGSPQAQSELQPVTSKKEGAATKESPASQGDPNR